ncbi:MAG TPA: hypothetical protein DCY13_04655, partial [Verrucomicrobiales bacterium]|nr:hypothetical protein [Verrucomicrobiales bacterium]
MARPTHPFGFMTEHKAATRALIRFCRDHDLREYLPQLEGCLRCLEADDPAGAFEFFRQVRPSGHGSITDCAPRPVHPGEDDAY